jgi:hypothetical protein
MLLKLERSDLHIIGKFKGGEMKKKIAVFLSYGIIILILVSISSCLPPPPPMTLNVTRMNPNDAKKQFIQSISRGCIFSSSPTGGNNVASLLDIDTREFIGVKSSGDSTIFLYGNSTKTWPVPAPYGFILIDINNNAAIKTRKSNLGSFVIVDLFNIKICAGPTNSEPQFAGGSYSISVDRNGVNQVICGNGTPDMYNRGDGGQIYFVTQREAEDFVSSLVSVWPKVRYANY